MDAPHVTQCPTETVLSDFGLGKLDAASAERVSRHIETCADCRWRVASLSGDSFVGRLRQAGGAVPPAGGRQQTYVPGESMANTASSTDGSLGPEDALPGPSRTSREAARRDGPGGPSSVTAPPELMNHPDYELVKELGQGGMGTVYLARNRMMDRPEVLKVISRSLLDRPGALERFQQEIRSAAKLAHPNIVAAYTVLRPGDLLVFAMEYVRGQDLAEVVKQRGPLPVANATFYIHQVALGLQHAHEKGMVHRDIKPNNLMLAIEGKKHVVKILDFGLAKATSEKGAETGLTKSGQMLGTPDYVAPEQTLDAHQADIRADIYSLGCTLYFLLSGGPPFQETSLYEILEAHHKRDPKPLNLIRPDVPVELAAVVGKMMAKDPTKRYQTPIEVAKALVAFFKPGQSVVTPAPTEAGNSQPAETEHGISSVTPAAPIAPPPVAFPVWVGNAPVAALSPTALPTEEPAEDFSVSISTERPAVRQRGWWASLPPWRKMAIALGASAAAVLVLGVLLVRTPHGTIQIELSDPKANVTVTVDGDKVDIARPDNTPEEKKADASKRFPCEIYNPELARWSIDGDELVQSSTSETIIGILFGDPTWEDVDFSAEAMRVEGNDLCALSFRFQATEDRDSFVVGGNGNATYSVDSVDNGTFTQPATRQASLTNGKWYRLELRLRGKSAECYLDGKQVLSCELSRGGRGRLGLGTWISAYRFRNIMVKAPDGTILLEGLPDLDGALEHQGDANALNNASWEIAVRPDARAEDYQRALRLAQAACRIKPEDGNYLNTLGVAQYRVGQFAEALATLNRSVTLNVVDGAPEPVDVAFLAMTHHALGNADSAKAFLAQMRELANQPRWHTNAEAQSLLREAEEEIKTADYDAIATGTWIRVMPGETELQHNRAAVPQQTAGDVIIRARVKKVSGQNLGLFLRAEELPLSERQPGGKWARSSYAAWFNGGNWFGVFKSGEGTTGDLGQWHTPSNFDDYFEFAFSAVGETLTVYADGKRVGEVRDADYRRGSLGISALRGRSLFQDVEIMILDKESAPGGQGTPPEPSEDLEMSDSETAPDAEAESAENDETEPDTQNDKKTDSPPNSRRAKAKPIDLLKQLDLKQPGTVGEWHMQRRQLVFPQVEFPSIAIYDRAPEEYTLTAVVQCASHMGGLGFGIVVGNSQATVSVDAYGKQFSGLGLINGLGCNENETCVPGSFLIDGRPNVIECTVRKNRVQLSCNGKQLVNWTGDPSALSITPSPFADRHGSRQLFIGRGNPPSPFVVTKLTLRPLGTVEVNAKTSATAKLPVKRFPCRILEGLRNDLSIDGDELVQNSLQQEGTLIFGDSKWGDYDFSVEVKKVAGSGLLVLVFANDESAAQSFFYGLGTYNNTQHDAGYNRADKLTYFGRRQGSLDQGRWYRAEVRVRGKRCECFLDGERLFDFTADGMTKGPMGLHTNGTAYRFRNIVVKAPDGTVLLEGLPDLGR
jgi:serine/threonine protein kinase/tetratricopeptide (TPR) repeat protein